MNEAASSIMAQSWSWGSQIAVKKKKKIKNKTTNWKEEECISFLGVCIISLIALCDTISKSNYSDSIHLVTDGYDQKAFCTVKIILN